MNYRQILFLSGVLSFACLFIPFIWLEIGPGGYKLYGPTVPHIFIYGGLITGKDLSFWGISFAFITQLCAILFFSITSFLAQSSRSIQRSFNFLILHTFLLALFPFWLKTYVWGVICNSDGADLTIHWQAGIVLYAVLVFLNIFGLIQTFRASR